MHKIVERPVIREGQIVARPMMNASIGFDHRVVDGELAVKFLRRLCGAARAAGDAVVSTRNDA